MLIDRTPPPKVWRMPRDPKPVLKARLEPGFRVHYTDLEKYIKQVFGFPYDFLVAEGLKLNGPCIEYEITGRFAKAFDREAGDLRFGFRTKNTPLILGVLVQDGYIHAGTYYIETKLLPDTTEQYRKLLYQTLDADAQVCRDFKHTHRNDAVFMSRVPVLEAALADENQRGQNGRTTPE